MNRLATTLPMFLVAAALAAGSLGQEPAPADRQILVGNRRLRARVLGEGAPALVLDTGMGDALEAWGELPAALAATTRVVIYDRAGIGQSELGPEPRQASAVARDLQALLAGLDIPGPFVLVGHSLGGLHIRAFAALYPENVAGLVFLDPTTEGMHQSLATEEGRQAVAEQLVDETPGVQAEGLSLWPSLQEIAGLGPPPDVPALVFTALAPPEIPEEFRQQAEAMGITLERLQELQALKLRFHQELAAKMPRAEHVIAERSQHYVHYDEPELVVARIATLIEYLRSDAQTVAGDAE